MDQLLSLDYYLFRLINQGMSNVFFDFLMPILRNKTTWYPLYILSAIVLVSKWKWQGLYLILFAILSLALSDLISSQVLKNLFARTRPCLLVELSTTINLLLDKCSGAYSFPSSHAANHFALASFFAYSFRKHALRFVLLFWASAICFAQVYVGVHFPSDVLFGALLGLSFGYLVYKIKKAVIKTAF
ncbi:MAG: phosphatase PAP2 family protein [Chitinophagales bacterium]|nr:phosphatase PAP2 family protein [Chitinophagales bacterium]